MDENVKNTGGFLDKLPFCGTITDRQRKEGMTMSGRKRMFALLLCVGMALMLLVSSAYLVSAARHFCPGEHCCETCHAMLRTEALLSAFVFFAVVLLLNAFTAADSRKTIADSVQESALPLTLVGRKVQLNN